MKLTKKYRVVYSTEKQIIMSIGEYPLDSETNVPNDRECAEFDTLEEAENFIIDNNLIYAY